MANPICSKCKKPVDAVGVERDQPSRATNFRFDCHGDTDVVIATDTIDGEVDRAAFLATVKPFAKDAAS